MPAMSVTSTSPRRHHTELQPLTTRPSTPITPGRRASTQILWSIGISSPAVPSPSIVAARAYYLQHATPIGPDTDAQQRRKSLIEAQLLPRRHSVVSSTETLEAQLENFSFSGNRRLQTVHEGEETGPKIKEEECDQVDIRESIESDEVEVQSKSDLMCGTPQEVLRHVPFQYTHDHLRDWAYAYLGKSATADAFVNAVSLRMPSMAALQEDLKSGASSLVVIRARVTPKSKDRKPFLIQRQSDIEELRSSMPVPKASEDMSTGSPKQLRRSTRVRRQSVQPSAGETQRRKSLNIPTTESIAPLSNGLVPIHIEYALHYLPVLAALMLSGHVQKGDNIDLPVPHPAAWHEVVTFIYTGSGIPTSAVRQNILYLAGHA